MKFSDYCIATLKNSVSVYFYLLVIIDVITMLVISNYGPETISSDLKMTEKSNRVIVFVFASVINGIVSSVLSFIYTVIHRNVVRKTKEDYYLRMFSATKYTLRKLRKNKTSMKVIGEIPERVSNYIMNQIFNYNSLVNLSFVLFSAYRSSAMSVTMLFVCIHVAIAYYVDGISCEHIKRQFDDGEIAHNKLCSKLNDTERNGKNAICNNLIKPLNITKDLSVMAEEIESYYQQQYTVRSATRNVITVAGQLLGGILMWIYNDKILFMAFWNSVSGISSILNMRSEYLSIENKYEESEKIFSSLEYSTESLDSMQNIKKTINDSTDIEIRSLNFKFDNSAPIAVSCNDIIFKPKEIIKISGKNGNGKSTFYYYVSHQT